MMAFVVRPRGPVGPNVASGHIPSGGRNIASVGYGPVDELYPANAMVPDPNFAFQGYSDWGQYRQGQQVQLQPPPPPPPANTVTDFTVNSNTFLSLMLQHQQQDLTVPENGMSRSAPGFRNRVNQAINTYEGVAHVISGEPPHRGENV
ncbi:MAG: hypothetical protein HQL36_05845, partial [Alphaproteobacteria bacterium]|nr:hypothetical protein [Alphaproteobacteria bacterium]